MNNRDKLVLKRGIEIIPILKNNLTALTRLAVLGVLSAARRLVILFFRIGIIQPEGGICAQLD